MVVYVGLYGSVWIYMDLFAVYKPGSFRLAHGGETPQQLRCQNALPASTASGFPAEQLCVARKKRPIDRSCDDGFGKTICACSL